MTVHAIYEFTSICGQNFQTEDPNRRACPECGRSAVLDWSPAVATAIEKEASDEVDQ